MRNSDKPRRGIIADAFHPFLVLFTIVSAIAAIYFLAPLVNVLQSVTVFIAETTGIGYVYAMCGMLVLAGVFLLTMGWIYIAPIFKQPCYDFSAPQALADSKDKGKCGLFKRTWQRYRFHSFMKHLLEAPVPENMDNAHRREYDEALEALKEAKSDEEICAALEKMGVAREKHMKSIVLKHVVFVSLSTAISKKSWLDAYLSFSSNLRMIRELIIASGHRPNYKDCIVLYSKCAVYALCSLTMEELTTYMTSLELVKAGRAAVTAGIQWVGTAIGAAVTAVCGGADCGAATVAISKIFGKVGKAVVDCAPETLDGVYNGWRTMRLGYHLSDLLTGVYYKDAHSNDSMWSVAQDLPDAIRAMMSSVFYAMGKNLDDGSKEIEEADAMQEKEGRDTTHLNPLAAAREQEGQHYTNEGRDTSHLNPLEAMQRLEAARRTGQKNI